MPVRAAGSTHVGCLRDDNQDAILVDPSRRLFAVADGLGGLARGGEASRLAIRRLDYLFTEFRVDHEVPDLGYFYQLIHEEVRGLGRSAAGVGTGTTLTTLWLGGDRACIGHVGDSVALVWRQGMTRQLTRNHTMAQEVTDGRLTVRGGKIPDCFYHTLLRCVGQEEALAVDTHLEAWRPGDRWLLCSDGLLRVFSVEECGERLGQASGPEVFVEALIGECVRRGAPDDVSAVAVFA